MAAALKFCIRSTPPDAWGEVATAARTVFAVVLAIFRSELVAEIAEVVPGTCTCSEFNRDLPEGLRVEMRSTRSELDCLANLTIAFGSECKLR